MKKLRQLFVIASDQWSDQRPKDKLKKATEKYPEVADWVDNQPEGRRDAARRLMQTIAGLHLDTGEKKEKQRVSLYKAGILAFERIGVDATINELDRLSTGLRAEDLLPLLAHARSYEDALYIQILRSRLEAIGSLRKLIDNDEKEKVLQKHLFDNMWLLDPSWEGATGDVDMEKSLRRIRREAGLFDVTEESWREQGRIDIKYRTVAGLHMIVELKRYQRRIPIDELYDQGDKYYRALEDVLKKTGAKSRTINVVFVLGQEPIVDRPGRLTVEQAIENRLNPINGRILYYDELLTSAAKRYQEYRDQQSKTSSVNEIIKALDERSPD